MTISLPWNTAKSESGWLAFRLPASRRGIRDITWSWSRCIRRPCRRYSDLIRGIIGGLTHGAFSLLTFRSEFSRCRGSWVVYCRIAERLASWKWKSIPDTLSLTLWTFVSVDVGAGIVSQMLQMTGEDVLVVPRLAAVGLLLCNTKFKT